MCCETPTRFLNARQANAGTLTASFTANGVFGDKALWHDVIFAFSGSVQRACFLFANVVCPTTVGDRADFPFEQWPRFVVLFRSLQPPSLAERAHARCFSFLDLDRASAKAATYLLFR